MLTRVHIGCIDSHIVYYILQGLRPRPAWALAGQGEGIPLDLHQSPSLPRAACGWHDEVCLPLEGCSIGVLDQGSG